MLLIFISTIDQECTHKCCPLSILLFVLRAPYVLMMVWGSYRQSNNMPVKEMPLDTSQTHIHVRAQIHNVAGLRDPFNGLGKNANHMENPSALWPIAGHIRGGTYTKKRLKSRQQESCWIRGACILQQSLSHFPFFSSYPSFLGPHPP